MMPPRQIHPVQQAQAQKRSENYILEVRQRGCKMDCSLSPWSKVQPNILGIIAVQANINFELNAMASCTHLFTTHSWKFSKSHRLLVQSKVACIT